MYIVILGGRSFDFLVLFLRGLSISLLEILGLLIYFVLFFLSTDKTMKWVWCLVCFV